MTVTMAEKQVNFDDTAKKLKALSESNPASITQLLLSLIPDTDTDQLMLSTHYRVLAHEVSNLQSRTIAALDCINDEDTETTINDLLMHVAITGRVSNNLSCLANSVGTGMEKIDERRQHRDAVNTQRKKLEMTFRSRMAEPEAVTHVAGKERPRLFSRTERNF